MMYEITFIDADTSVDIGSIYQPTPPGVGDRFIFGSWEYNVTARIFNYNDNADSVIIWGRKRR